MIKLSSDYAAAANYYSPACDGCGDTKGMETDEILCTACKAHQREAKARRLAGVRGLGR